MPTVAGMPQTLKLRVRERAQSHRLRRVCLLSRQASIARKGRVRQSRGAMGGQHTPLLGRQTRVRIRVQVERQVCKVCTSFNFYRGKHVYLGVADRCLGYVP